jgi:hypothetical protein
LYNIWVERKRNIFNLKMHANNHVQLNSFCSIRLIEYDHLTKSFRSLLRVQNTIFNYCFTFWLNGSLHQPPKTCIGKNDTNNCNMNCKEHFKKIAWLHQPHGNHQVPNPSSRCNRLDDPDEHEVRDKVGADGWRAIPLDAGCQVSLVSRHGGCSGECLGFLTAFATGVCL